MLSKSLACCTCTALDLGSGPLNVCIVELCVSGLCDRDALFLQLETEGAIH